MVFTHDALLVKVKRRHNPLLGFISRTMMSLLHPINIMNFDRLTLSIKTRTFSFLSVCDKCIAAISDENWAILVAN